ncbi:glycoside hydrolase family 10 protein [Pendulispora albinea]|uniref:Family 10 glycosylhydrolase n=1 Tax=Pendulispora albinea TaxID=2741071 RepID=A0ABZ2LL43_9BACT
MLVRTRFFPSTALALGAVLALTIPANAADGPATCPTNPAHPKRQLRAEWIASVVNIDWPSRQGLSVQEQQAEYVRLLDDAKSRKLNAVVVQIRPTADAFWPSPYEPWSEWLTGEQGRHPGYDPLAFLIREAHARDLAFHAWFNPYRVSMQNDPSKLVPSHPARQHPDWVFAYGPKLYYDPGVPAARAFVENAILHAVENYDVDGVHFDDYFYPYPIAGQALPDQRTYEQYGGGFANIDDWRRHNVDRLVEETNARIHAKKPWVAFGISPFGIWRNRASDPRGSDTAGFESYSGIYADSLKWVDQGWVDYINPQVYWNIGLAVADYAKLVPWWAERVRGTGVHLYVGQAAYKVGTSGAWLDPAELSRHLSFNRSYPEVQGDVYFSAKDVAADRLGSITQVVAEHYARPALLPAETRRGGHAPQAPHAPLILRVSRAGEGAELTVRAFGGGATSFAVYRFDGVTFPGECAFADAAHLLGTVRAQGITTAGASATFVDPSARPDATYTYYATALDRLQHESARSLPRVLR